MVKTTCNLLNLQIYLQENPQHKKTSLTFFSFPLKHQALHCNSTKSPAISVPSKGTGRMEEFTEFSALHLWGCEFFVQLIPDQTGTSFPHLSEHSKDSERCSSTQGTVLTSTSQRDISGAGCFPSVPVAKHPEATQISPSLSMFPE